MSGLDRLFCFFHTKGSSLQCALQAQTRTLQSVCKTLRVSIPAVLWIHGLLQKKEAVTIKNQAFRDAVKKQVKYPSDTKRIHCLVSACKIIIAYLEEAHPVLLHAAVEVPLHATLCPDLAPKRNGGSRGCKTGSGETQWEGRGKICHVQ
eukprot:1154925-Pelagomonas_calceolata.AAC.7